MTEQSAVLKPATESKDSIKTTPNTNYWRQLGLVTSPFEGEAEPFFVVDQDQAYFSQLDQFRHSSHPLLLVPSIVGSGKTSILQQYMATQHEILGLHFLAAQPHFTLPQLVQQVFLQQANGAALPQDFRQINFQLIEYTRTQGDQLLIIDDAHRLSKDTLGQLLQFLVQLDLSQCGFRVVLSGEPQLEDRVNTLCDTLEIDLLATTLNIQAYSQAQTRDYLQHRLQQAGYSGKLPFNNAMVKHIHNLSGGYPGRINRVAQQVLVDCLKDNQVQLVGGSSLIERFYQHKVKVFSVLLLSVFLWALWQGKQQGQLNWFAKSEPGVITEPLAQPLPTVPTVKEAANDTSSETARQLAIALSQQRHLTREIERHTHHAQLDLQTREITHPVAVKPIRDAFRPGAIIAKQTAEVEMVTPSESAPETVTTTIPETVSESSVPALASKAQAPAAKKITLASNTAQVNTPKITTTAKAQSTPLATAIKAELQTVKSAEIKPATLADAAAPMAKASSTKLVAVVKAQATPKKEKKLAAKAAPKKVSAAKKPVAQTLAVKAPEPAAGESTFSLRQHRKQAKVMHQEADKILTACSVPALGVCEHHYLKNEGFTLQLMGAHDVQRLADFIKRTHLHNNIHVFHTTFDGQPWYVLTYGDFESADAARSAVRRLPTVVQAQHPWVRSTHSIQKLIQQL